MTAQYTAQLAEGIAEVLDLIYGDERTNYTMRCLNATVSVTGKEQAILAARHMPASYNEFSRQTFIEALGRLPAETFKYREFRMGRESSPVLYITCTRDEASHVLMAFADSSPDEVNLIHEEWRDRDDNALDCTPVTVRLWWD